MSVEALEWKRQRCWREWALEGGWGSGTP